MNELNAHQLLRIQDASRLTTLGKSTIRLWIAQGKFPEPITLSPTIKVWRVEQILDWIEQQNITAETSTHQVSNVEQPNYNNKVIRSDLEKIQ